MYISGGSTGIFRGLQAFLGGLQTTTDDSQGLRPTLSILRHISGSIINTALKAQPACLPPPSSTHLLHLTRAEEAAGIRKASTC